MTRPHFSLFPVFLFIVLMNRFLRCASPSSLRGVSVRRHNPDTKEFPDESNQSSTLKRDVICLSH
ncbi:hypothetical protein EJA71_26410 [Pseudomonas sp. PB106]|nr:hypothetical protein EJA71_26410 [Pseudomonas sp. PB106]